MSADPSARAARRARAALSRLIEPGTPQLGALLASVGPEEAYAVLSSGRGSVPDGLRKQAGSRVAELDVDRDLAVLAACGGRLVCPEDAEWPACVDVLGPTRPVALWVRGGGELAALTDAAVAMVGARACTSYGQHVATGMAADLAERGWTVISGGAYGIDAAAHRGALAVGGPTVAVLACGVDVPYPRSHHSLFAELREHGLLVSELPPGSAPYKHRFLTRNRLIAALAAGTIVVEAALRSGAGRTAADTRTLGRHLMAVPGPVSSPMSAGCHALLRDDEPAVLVTSAAEVLELVGRMGEDLAPRGRGPVHLRDDLSPELARVLDALPVRRAQGPARIAVTAGLPLEVVEPALGHLAVLGLAQYGADGWRIAAAARAPQPARGA